MQGRTKIIANFCFCFILFSFFSLVCSSSVTTEALESVLPLPVDFPKLFSHFFFAVLKPDGLFLL